MNEPRCRGCGRSQAEVEDAGTDWDYEEFAQCQDCDPTGLSGRAVVDDPAEQGAPLPLPGDGEDDQC